MEIRLLGPGDERLAGQACRLYTAEAVEPAAFLNTSNAALLVATDGDDVVGCVYGHELVHPDSERTMLLYSLDVLESHRGRGVGKQLVGTFVEHARDRGCTEVWVLTEDDNPAALATYASAGGRRDPVNPVMFTWRLAEGLHS
jgi:[ribosomal protein S18]-alanine N-acetyltransferase